MSLILGISTSSPQFDVVLEEDSTILYSSKDSAIATRDITHFIMEGLEHIGKTPQDIKNILVDIGPGGTSIVRTGVAFANSLSYSLGISVIPVSSFELLGLEAWQSFHLPVICTANSMKGNAYIGLFHQHKILIKHGNLESIVKEITAEIDEFCVAGFHNEALITMFPNKKIRNSELKFANAKILVEQMPLFLDRAVSFPNLPNPITEQSVYLYE